MKVYYTMAPSIIRWVFFFLITLATTGLLNAQKLEFSLQLSSGLFSYSGASVKKSYLIYSDTGYPSSTRTPFGANNGISYGFAFQLHRITKTDLILGIQTGYEVLRSKVDLFNEIQGAVITISDGNTFLTNHSINIFPYLGKRFTFNNDLSFDISIGTDIAYNLYSYEFTWFIDNQEMKSKYWTYYDYENPGDLIEGSRTPVDIRPRIGLTTYYKKFGLHLGYSNGISNYQNSRHDQRGEIYSRYIRIGILYKINGWIAL